MSTQLEMALNPYPERIENEQPRDRWDTKELWVWKDFTPLGVRDELARQRPPDPFQLIKGMVDVLKPACPYPYWDVAINDLLRCKTQRQQDRLISWLNHDWATGGDPERRWTWEGLLDAVFEAREQHLNGFRAVARLRDSLWRW